MQVANTSTNVILSSVQDPGNNCLFQTSSVPQGRLQRGNEDSYYNTKSTPAGFLFWGLKKKLKNIFCWSVEVLWSCLGNTQFIVQEN